MSGRKGLSEWIKNIIILLLLVSAVFLGWQSQLFGNVSVKLNALTNPAGDNSVDSGSDVQAEETKNIGQARPVSIAVTDSSGAHYGAKYDLNAIDNIYGNTVLIFREALWTAQTPEKADERAWRAALRSPGVYFEYMTPIRLSILDGWFEAEITGGWRDLSVRRLCVAVVAETPRLYFQEDGTGTYYAAETEVLREDITKLTGKYAANNAAFAFEMLETPLKSPYALVLREASGHPKLEVKNLLTGEPLTEVLRKLGVSEHKKPIQLDNGDLAYPEEDFRIELSPDGTLSYKRTGSPEASNGDIGESGAVELARRVVAESVGKYCGDAARVYFDTVRTEGPNSYLVTFTYIAAGGRVYPGRDRHAAAVTVTDGTVSKMSLCFRSFSIAGEENGLLPEIQTAAATGGAFMLCYTDGGDGVFKPSWVIVSDDS